MSQSVDELKGYVTFIDRHKPKLKRGDYTLKVQQNISLKDVDAADNAEIAKAFPSHLQKFSILGDRFSLASNLVHSAFPPAGNIGEYSQMMPHVILRRSTLPYERTIDQAKGEAVEGKQAYDHLPWLAVLTFDERAPSSGGDKQTTTSALRPTWTIDKAFFIRRYADDRAEIIWSKLINAELLKLIQSGSNTYRVSQDLADGDYSSSSDSFTQEEQEKINKVLSACKYGQALTLQEFMDSQGDPAIYFPEFELEAAQSASDYVKVIDVKCSVLKKLLPPLDDLNWLAHVRHVEEPIPEDELPAEKIRFRPQQSDDSEEEPSQGFREESRAVVVSNRLPGGNGQYFAHLISLEGRFIDGVFDCGNFEDGSDGLIRLVTLHDWNFSCISNEHRFEALLQTVNRGDKGTLRLPEHILSFGSMSEKTAEQTEEAKSRLQSGFVLLPHHLRNGGKTVSYYRSPLLPGRDATTFQGAAHQLPARVSDNLLRYDEHTGAFEASYAAAYEIGRLITLQNSDIGLKLLAWKQELRHNSELHKDAEYQRFQSTLFRNRIQRQLTLQPKNDEVDLDKQELFQWFFDLMVLRHIPFNYLVPDERMLPEEAIRFFHIDCLWLAALLDGSFSVGRVTPKDAKRDQYLLKQEGFTAGQLPLLSGFILRSEAVAGWPDLDTAALNTVLHPEDGVDLPFPTKDKLPRLRMDRLSDDTLICIFVGEVKTLDIYLKPEGLQFGFKFPGSDEEQEMEDFYKTWKNPENGLPNTEITKKTLIEWANKDLRLMDMSEFVEKMPAGVKPGDTEASAFALQMIEGMPRVRYLYDEGSGQMKPRITRKSSDPSLLPRQKRRQSER